jgi:hypothetical protein
MKVWVPTADHKNHERSSHQVVHHPCHAAVVSFSFCEGEEVRIDIVLVVKSISPFVGAFIEEHLAWK